jgi:endoribonuclease LACTB2
MAEPIAASVVVLHRQRDGVFEVYWVRRSHTLPFLPGFWAFPGGRVDPADTGVVVPGLDGDAALRRVAAARELHEETGVSVPVRASTFVDIGRTITPDWAPIRFDATYYLVEMPAGVEPDPVGASGGELNAGEWITPIAALEAYTSGERLTSPVVAFFLEALVDGIDGAAARVAASAGRDDSLGRLWELAPGIATSALRTPTLPPATHTNCYVVGGAELIVVDPASPWDDERAALDVSLAELAARGRRVREIWLTHHHVDHVSGAAHLAARLGVPIAAHAETARLVAPRITVARTLADGHVETLPGWGAIPERRLRCVFTPGHAPGHHVFFEETTRFLIAGDMVAGVGTIVVDPDEGDMSEYLASLRRLAALDPRVLLPAHGNSITDPQAKLAEYQQHRLWREQQVATALAARGAPATALELVPAVYADVAPSLHPLAARSLLAHLIKLVKDGRVTQAGDRFAATPA